MSNVTDICTRAAETATAVAALSTAIEGCSALKAMADALLENAVPLVEANKEDVERAKAEGTSNTIVDRLTLTDSRLTVDGRRICGPSPLNPIRSGRSSRAGSGRTAC